MRILADIVCRKPQIKWMITCPSLNSTRREPVLEAPCKIPGRQVNYPATQSPFHEYPV
jgi:hypothetical protein